MENKESILMKQDHESLVKKAKDHAYSPELTESVTNILKILGEPSRLKIVLALSEGEMCVFHIVESVGLNQSAVSHQLRILKDNKIIKSRREGQNILYSLDDEHIMQIINLVRTHVEEE